MNLTIVTDDGNNVVVLQVSEDDQLSTVKTLIEQEWNIPSKEQQLKFEGKVLSDQTTLKSSGVKNDDMLILSRVKNAVSDLASSLLSALQNTSRPRNSSSNSSNILFNINRWIKPESDTPEGWLQNARKFSESVRTQPGALDQISQVNPGLSKAILDNDYPYIIGTLKHFAAKQEAERLRRLAQTDPQHPDVQKAIEEQIKQKAIDEQMEYAMEHNPEAFATVIMLYCHAEINKNPVHAFIDSGAQMTIMSQACAERCGIMRFVDTRMASIARGVGESKILGKIHSAMLKIGNSFIDISISVIEQNTIEFILGLDMLKRHRCLIDLANGYLVLGDDKIPFLSEGELPHRLRGSNAIKTSAEISIEENEMINKKEEEQPTIPNHNSGTTSTASASTAQVDPQKLALLMDMGITKEAATEALLVTNGDVEKAAAYLLN